MRWRSGILLAVLILFSLAGASTGAPSPTHVHFTAAGDFAQSPNTTAQVLTAMGAAGADLNLALGDLSYGATGQEDTWCDFVKSRVGESAPFELISGNHESNGLNGNINDFSACLPNQLPGLVGTYGRQYYVDVPQTNPLVRFVMISPNITFPSGQWNYPAGSARYNWTASTIDDARADGIPWVVVGMHKPCLSLGEYNCDVGADLVNMLLAKRVDLVLSGHEHLYQRTKQLGLRSGCPALTIGSYNPSCVVDADDTMVKGAGTVFATVGTGGNALRDIDTADPEAPYFAATNGSNQNPTYGFGDFDVTPDVLTMRFARGVGGTFADTVTMTRGTGANGNPVASFTSSSSQLTASFDASGSGDPDGTIAGYAWDFGDGTTGQGVSPQHAYTAAGSYPVKLTVTDDAGATDTLTRSVTVTAPPPASVVASDGFDRNLTGSWGRADAGGDWSLRGTTARFTVASSAGRIQVPAGSTLYADLNQVGTTSVRLTADFSVDRLSEGTYISLVGRQIGTETYVTRLRLQADGKSKLYLLRGSGTALGTVVSPDTTFVPGEHYLLSMEVKGVSPTTVSVKVWKLGDPEPTAWARTVTDSFAALQAPGRIGVFSYLPSTTTNGPVTLSFHQLTANDAG